MTIATRLAPLFTAAAICLVIGSNLAQARQAHADLETTVTNQNVAIRNAARAETQLNALAKGTQSLAKDGNANAIKIVAILNANGVSIKN